jgi:hypothetical protein
MRSIVKRLLRRHGTAVAYLALSPRSAAAPTRRSPLGETGTKGETGPAGPQGVQGPAGPAGPSGISGWEYRVSDGVYVSPDNGVGAHRYCPIGKKAIGGGASRSGNFWTYVTQSALIEASDGATGWTVSVWNDGPTGATVYAWVICADVSS